MSVFKVEREEGESGWLAEILTEVSTGSGSSRLDGGGEGAMSFKVDVFFPFGSPSSSQHLLGRNGWRPLGAREQDMYCVAQECGGTRWSERRDRVYTEGLSSSAQKVVGGQVDVMRSEQEKTRIIQRKRMKRADLVAAGFH